ncbi:hypothetical protein ACFL41_00375 [Gemmatimonadota bacterium]
MKIEAENMRWIWGILSVVLLCSCGNSKSNDIEGAKVLSYEWMWNPEATDLETWQFIGANPPELIRGGPGVLFLLDQQNTHVLQITTTGELIQVIGQRGNGPGELDRPFTLGYDEEKDVLWVGDLSGGRISRFQISETTHRFLDSFTSTAVSSQRWYPSFSILDSHTFCSNYFTFQAGVRLPDQRIKLIQDDGSILRSFGSPWDAQWAEDSRHILRANYGDVICINQNLIAFVWTMRPRIELWNAEGRLINETELLEPELQRPEPEENAPGSMVYPIYFPSASWSPEQKLLYLCANVTGGEKVYFFGLSVEDLAIRVRYVLEIPQSAELEISPSRFAVHYSNDEVSFYALDRNQSGVLVLKPIPQTTGRDN